jgi:protoporphyrin/coproporphyrin ferrochelatase
VTVGVVLMAYGTPASVEEILPYYTDIRRGRPPTDAQLAELTARYAAIGGLSPLAERTAAQGEVLRAALGDGFVVELGMKHAAPSIEQAVGRFDGVARIVGLVLAPHDSAFSVGQYHERAAAAAGRASVPYAGVRSWATLPAYVDFVATEVTSRLAALPAGTEVLFTAHSLPQRILATGDPYPDELHATATAVAESAGLTRWSTAWQSAGRTPEPWLGPDILEVIDSTTAAGLLVAAVGFVADHLEVLYDLDIEASQRAVQRGLAFDRCACVNDHPAVFAALAELVRTT